MKLSELIRKKEVATVTVATHATNTPLYPTSVATVASVNVANNETEVTYWRWLVHCPDRDIEISTIPESGLVQVLLDFPTATGAEPIFDTPKRKATDIEKKELAELVDLIYAKDIDADRAEALAAALADPDEALTCYRDMQNTLQTRTAALSLPGNVLHHLPQTNALQRILRSTLSKGNKNEL